MKKEELRNKFFAECTDVIQGVAKVNLSPSNLFEWIWENAVHVCEYCNDDAVATCCDNCLQNMVESREITTEADTVQSVRAVRVIEAIGTIEIKNDTELL